MYSRGYRKEVFLILQILGAITVPAHVLEGIVLWYTENMNEVVDTEKTEKERQRRYNP